MPRTLIDTPGLLDFLRSQFQLNWEGIHGVSHWQRVYATGRELATLTGVTGRVAEYFALFHDVCRLNDGIDTNHGTRAAAFVTQHRGEWIDLSDTEFIKLHYAITHHSDKKMHKDLIIQVCWDADRLDLGRVGIQPDPRFLGTEAARNLLKKNLFDHASHMGRNHQRNMRTKG